MKNLLHCSSLIFVTLFLVLGRPGFVKAQTGCSPLWEQLRVSHCYGSAGMEAIDYDNDGQKELVMGSGDYWYIMEYVPERENYEVVWMSRRYDYNTDDGPLSALKIMDVDFDGQMEVLAGINGRLEVYDLAELRLETVISTPAVDDNIWQIMMADADNDGEVELLMSTYDEIMLYNTIDGKFEFQQSVEGDFLNDFACGDTDGDGTNSLIFNNGTLVTIENGEVSAPVEYCNTYLGGIQIEAYDVDGDGADEVIHSGSFLRVIDADTKQVKWEFYSQLSMDVIMLADVNNDNNPELLAGDQQWGNLNCWNPLTGGRYWQIENPDSGFENILVADSDNDGNREVLWASGCSTGDDHLYVYNLTTKQPEWVSEYIYGAFTGMDAGDVDGDGQSEIVTLSSNGKLVQFDATTRELEWQNNQDFYESDYLDFSILKLDDVDNDGSTEIIIAGGQFYDPFIIVINGNTHEIESEHYWTYTSAIDNIISLDVRDFDNNGTKEFICIDDEYVYIINSSNYSVIWQTSSSNWLTEFVAADADEDPALEIAMAGYNLTVYDVISHEQEYQLPNPEEDRFISVTSFDSDNDGKAEIIAGTMLGKIMILDMQTLDTTWINPGVNTAINAIKAGNFSSTPGTEYVFTTFRHLNFFHSDSILLQINIHQNSNLTKALEVKDYNNDGVSEIMVGTFRKAVEYSTSCFGCTDFDVEDDITYPACNNNNGSIVLQPSNGQAPYSYLWNGGYNTPALGNVEADFYAVWVNDSGGCTWSADYQIPMATVSVDSVITSGDNTSTSSCEGRAQVYLKGGTPPYRYAIGTDTLPMVNNQITGLCAGIQLVTFIDSRNCDITTAFQIEEIVGLSEWQAGKDFSVYPIPFARKLNIRFNKPFTNDAMVEISTMQGVILMRTQPHFPNSTLDLSTLSKGIYILSIVDKGNRTNLKIVKE